MEAIVDCHENHMKQALCG